MDQLSTYVEPLRKKWIYHFIISPKTNSIEKPEWYFGQTRKWIYEHIETVESKVKLSRDELGSKTKCNHVRHRFILVTVELVMVRLTKDMKKVTEQIDADPHYEAVLMHTYNEVIQFTKTVCRLLGECFHTIEDKYDMLSVFSNQRLFERIVDIEWEYAETNLKNISNLPTKWEPVLEGDFTDEYKVPTCVDRFLLLIKSLTERVECFKQLDCQMKLVELQSFLFENFLKFLKKSTDSNSNSKNIITGMLFFENNSTIDLTRILRVINGVNFLRLILIERNFVPKNVIAKLDITLSSKMNKLAQDYKDFYYALVEKVVDIYEYVDCDLQKFLNFIKPKLCNPIYELIRGEASKIHEQRQTQYLLGSLSRSDN